MQVSSSSYDIQLCISVILPPPNHTYTISLFDDETEFEHGPAVAGVLDRPRILLLPSILLQRKGKLVLLTSRNRR
jgi:hypothetical protein